MAASDIRIHNSLVSAQMRQQVLRQQALTLWLTGLPGAGKSTLAFALEHALLQAGQAAYVLDGDNVRHGLNRDLGFSAADRSENIRRVAEVARLMNDAGLIVISAFISPSATDRRLARSIIGEERFIEVHLNASLEVCEQRDPKGLYKRARRGEIAEFTGISSPYEAPEQADVCLETGTASPEACVQHLLQVLNRCRLDHHGRI